MKWSASHPLGVATSNGERLAIAISVGAMGTLGFAVTSPILPDLADTFGVSRGAIGLVQASVSIPGVVFSALIGYLADRLGRRRVILVALALFTTFGLAGFIARSYWGLIGVRIVQGIGTSGILGVGIVLIGDTFEGRARTRAMGINITGVTIVSMSGPIISGLLASGGTFRSFLIFGIGVPLFFWATRMPADAPSVAVEPPLRHFSAAIAAMRRSGNLIDYGGLLLATLAGVFILHGLGLTVTPLFLESEFGTPVATRGLILATFQTGIILVAMRVSGLITKFGTRPTLTIAFGLMAIGTTIAGTAPTQWIVAVGLAIAGVGFGLYIPLAQSFAAAVGGDAYRGVTVLVWVTIVRVAQVIGPPTGSNIADSIGARPVYIAAAIGMALIAVSWSPLRRRLHGAPVAAAE